ncbi:hypothetical protein P280DRAFT_505726 [Massarina eburnea CBS 473.64]|uniref:Uncharacterized protein n=1 Tax=Massarina eburnea CBS 473.64 TaxID=1395130 RepID=A0A6A6S4N2_9PLEO|nr:hypothetical protein P280DRAFT_505726 [Massarina eburnea CBS 473.64]
MVAYKFVAAALSALVSSAIAGNAIIQNNCDYPLYMEQWVGGASKSSTNIVAGGKHSAKLVEGSQSVALKLARDKARLWAHGVTQFEYSVSDRLWYDVSFIDCVNGKDGSQCPGWAGGVKLSATGGQCAVAECTPGAYCDQQAYFVFNNDKATKSCLKGEKSGDIHFTLCSVKKAKKSIAGRLEYEVRDVEGAQEAEVQEPEQVEEVEVEESEVELDEDDEEFDDEDDVE